MTLGQKIRQARQDRGITQKELAEQIDKSYSSVQKYELDLAVPPISVIEDIAEALEVSSFYFLKGSGAESFASKPLPRSIGERLKIIRTDRQFTQQQLAEYADLSVSSVQLYESGRRTPSSEALHRLAQALECEEEELTNPEWPIEFTAPHNMESLFYNALVSPDERAMLSVFQRLNEVGQKKAIQRVEELAEIPRYQAKPATEATKSSSEGKDTPEE